MHPPRILLANHDQAYGESVSKALAGEPGRGYEVAVSSRGTEGMLDQAGQYHALVCTVENVSDVETVTRLKKANGTLPMVVLVPPHDRELGKLVMGAGADSILGIDGNPEIMAVRLRGALEASLSTARSGLILAKPPGSVYSRTPIAQRWEILRTLSGGAGRLTLDRYPILIVEEEESSAQLLQKALEVEGFGSPFQAASVDATLAFLDGHGEFADRDRFPYPVLVFLALRLGDRSGFEVLRWLRSRVEFNRMIVIVNSVSEDPDEVRRAYELGANSYVLKPATLEGCRELVTAIRLFWARLNV